MSDDLLAALPEHKAGLSISHNEHRGYYVTVAQEIAGDPDRYDGNFVSEDERQRAIDTDELWSIQWYPETPVGFHVLFASSLGALLQAIKDEGLASSASPPALMQERGDV